MSPHLPFRPEDVAGQAIGVAEAGAAILHLHARDPATSRPSAAEEHFMAFLPKVRKGCDAVVNLTAGGSAVMTLEQRLAGPMRAEMCSLNMGSMNFALYPSPPSIARSPLLRTTLATRMRPRPMRW
jgi:uncharacterized protein (DUF849 family)